MAEQAPAVEQTLPPQTSGQGLNEPKHDVEVKLGGSLNASIGELQDDESSPLHSVQTFEQLGLREEILKGLYAQNFKKPSKIQEKALPLMLANPPTNMIAQSQSGTGKTAAFVTTILSRIEYGTGLPQALVLVPSRELAHQIRSVIISLGVFCKELKVDTAVPGYLERGAPVTGDVIVGTPGTFTDIIRRELLNIQGIKLLVIDEADNMLDQQGLGGQSIRLRDLLPKDIQILLFSATFPPRVMKFAEKFAPGANQIKLRQQELTVEGIAQMYMDCPTEETKYKALLDLYGLMTVGSSVIFVKKRETADQIRQRMEDDGHKVTSLHGAKDGAERDTLLADFRAGRTKVLITTNVLARGIDVSTVSMVVNYDIPMKGPGEGEPDAETYLHRIGRTGRFGRVGVSISFVHDSKSFEALNSIAEYYGIDLVQLSTDDLDAAEAKVKEVIKSSRAAPSFPTGGEQEN